MTISNNYKCSLLLSRIILCLTLFPLSSFAFATEKIPVWTYYGSPPFITGEQQGLSYEFIELLNQYAKGSYQFELKFLPRLRIDRNLDDKIPGMVLFVNGLWMGDKNKTKYLWSEALLTDRNEILSRKRGKAPLKIDFNGSDSLKGLVFGGMAGHRYKLLESAFESGEIVRRNVREDGQNLELLLRNRIDVTTAASTVVRYEVKQKGLQEDVYFSPTPLYSYSRHFLIVKKLKHIKSFIDRFVESLHKSPDWKRIRDKYAVK